MKQISSSDATRACIKTLQSVKLQMDKLEKSINQDDESDDTNTTSPLLKFNKYVHSKVNQTRVSKTVQAKLNSLIDAIMID